jgi:transposase
VLQIRRNNPKLQQVYSQAEQNVAERVAFAFKNYFEGRAWFPRGKKFRDYRSHIGMRGWGAEFCGDSTQGGLAGAF